MLRPESVVSEVAALHIVLLPQQRHSCQYRRGPSLLHISQNLLVNLGQKTWYKAEDGWMDLLYISKERRDITSQVRHFASM